MEVYGWEEANADLNALSEKYGGHLDMETMSTEDARRLQQDIVPVMQKVFQRSTYAQNMLRLGDLEKISKLRHRMMQLDQYDAPGDLEYMGTNWDKMVETTQLSENEITAAQILYQLNEIVPADIMEMWSAMEESADE